MACHGLINVRLIALNKQPGVLPVGGGETWRNSFANIILKVTGPEATMACQDDQLCARIKAVIDGAIHGVQDLWDKYLSTEERGILLVDAKSVFNEINRIRIIWMIRHLWLSGARFVFN